MLKKIRNKIASTLPLAKADLQLTILSKKTFHYVTKTVQFAYLSGLLPYNWDVTKKTFIFDNSLHRKVIWAVHNVLYICYIIFVAIRWVQIAFFLETPATASAIGTLYVCSTYCLVPIVQLSICINYGHHHAWINIFTGTVRTFEHKHAHTIEKASATKGRAKIGNKGQHGNQPNKPVMITDCSKAIRNFSIGLAAILIMDSVSLFAQPDTPFFVTSLLQNPKEMSFFQLFPYALFDLYIWYQQLIVFYFYVFSQLAYLGSMKNMMNLISNNDKDVGSGENSSIGISARRFMTEFRQLQILQIYTNKIWSSTIALFEIFLVGACILSCYGAVKLHGSRAVQQGVVAVVCISVVLRRWGNMGEMYGISKDVLESWKPKSGFLWFKKFLMSTQPIRFNIGGFLYADRGTRLRILSIICENTATLLLSS